MKHTIGFEKIANSNEMSGFGAVLIAKEDEQRRAAIAAWETKINADKRYIPSAHIGRDARGRRILSSAEARAKLAARGVPENRLNALFNRERAAVERHYTSSAVTARG